MYIRSDENPKQALKRFESMDEAIPNNIEVRLHNFCMVLLSRTSTFLSNLKI